jgi:hypothetical protein
MQGQVNFGRRGAPMSAAMAASDFAAEDFDAEDGASEEIAPHGIAPEMEPAFTPVHWAILAALALLGLAGFGVIILAIARQP